MDKILYTQRLILRPLCVGDLVSAYAYSGDPENTRYMLWFDKTPADTERFLRGAETEWRKEKPKFFEFAVVWQGVHIGAISLYLETARLSGELGWILHRDYHGKGFATEAALAMRAFAFDEMRLDKLTAHCDARNRPSRCVMEKLGMVLVYADGARRDRRTRGDGA